jgi:2-methylcitrate dehydratase PrpD
MHPGLIGPRRGAASLARLTEHLNFFAYNFSSAIFWTASAATIAALPGPPFRALREQFEEYRALGRCTLIASGKTSADQAALFNSGLVRYVDLLDSYMSPGGLCHPSDNFGTVLAAAEQAGASGEEFMSNRCRNGRASHPGILVDWDDPSLVFVRQTVLKKYCSLIHGQPVLEATLDLKRSHGLVAVSEQVSRSVSPVVRLRPACASDILP